ncbi:MAG: DUF3344 domain-containing protein [candidate division WOR-3 bacterium]
MMMWFFLSVPFGGTNMGPDLSAGEGPDAGVYATDFTQYAKHVLKGNFTSTAATAYMSGGSVTMNLSTIPAGAHVAAAYLFWAGQTNALDEFANINFAGNPITGAVIGYDCSDCWNTAYASLYACDVTGYVTGNGSYVINGFNSLGDHIPGVDGFTLVVVYTDPTPTVMRVVSIWTGYIDLEGCGPSDTFWVQSGFQATNPIGDAKAALTINDPQDGMKNFANFNGNFVAYFDGTNPGNHWGHWEGDVSAWMSGGDNSATWYVERACPSGCDCIAPVMSVISVTTTESGTNESPAEKNQKPVIAGVVPGGIRLLGAPGATVRVNLYDVIGRTAYSDNISLSEEGIGFIPSGRGIWFVIAEGYGVVGKAMVP